MNWIERLPEVTGRDPYSQNGEPIILEYIWASINGDKSERLIMDIGSGDGFILSNSRYLVNCAGFDRVCYDRILDRTVTLDNCINYPDSPSIISIDIDGNDYWILDKQMPYYKPLIVCAEFNPAFTDSRTIAYNPNHEWGGDDYYGFSFSAGEKLAEKHGYKVIFQIADMNMIMVRKDLIEGLHVPEVTFKQSDYFKKSNRTDWVHI